jgi:putative heme iron utilization protein
MTAKEQSALPDILAEARRFRTSFDSLLLATASREGQPHASYAPYVLGDQGTMWVYLSELAVHTDNLLTAPCASVLFIEDERSAQHLFARKRLTCDCQVESVPRGTEIWECLMDRFIEKHGQFMTMLKGLEDFHLFSLMPISAVYVRGFAQAYSLTGANLDEIRHINDKGHRPRDPKTAEDPRLAQAE